MNISSTQPIDTQIKSPVSMHAAAKIYSKNSSVSLSTDASGFFANAEADVVHDLKKALMAAINCGDFDKAIHILKCLKELG